MLPFGIALCVLSVVLLVFGLRGRTIARGDFCRRCRFDLAGLPASAACPECGGDLSQPGSTRPALRRAHRPAVVLAILMLLGGGGLASYAIVSPGTSIYARLPDGTLILLDRIGVDAALSELAVRSDAFPGFSDAHLQTLLARGLAHQADTAVAWDPRWGQLLANAFLRQQMTREQMQAYIEAGIKPDIRIRDRAAADQGSVGYRVAWDATRITAPLPPGTGGSVFDIVKSITSVGVMTADGELIKPGGSRSETRFAIPTSAAKWGGSSRSLIFLPDFATADSLQEVTAFIEAALALQTADADAQELVKVKRFRVEQTVRILPAGSEIVRTVPDPAAAAAVRDAVELSGLRLDLGDSDSARWNRVNLQMRIVTGARATAGRVYVVSGGAEVELGNVNVPARDEADWHVGGSFRSGQDDAATVDLLRGWVEAGAVDIVFRSDAEAALNNPDIDEIVDVTLWFRDVPVTVVGESSTAAGPRARIRAEGAAPVEEAEPAGG